MLTYLYQYSLCVLCMAACLHFTSQTRNQYVMLTLLSAATKANSYLTVFIYSCPSSSPIKPRMVYSSGAAGLFVSAKSIFTAESSSSSVLATRRIETSDPKELGEAYLITGLGLGTGTTDVEGDSGAGTPQEEDKKPFARPKGPGRRR